MGRGPLTQETRKQRALNKASEFLASIGISTEGLEQPKETQEDKLREAESCLIYFNTRGSQFKEKQCLTCGELFAYRWNIDSITRCSTECYVEALKQIGLEWDPSREQSRRWGPYAPAVVPPKALSLLKDSFDPLEDEPYDKPL